MCPREERKEDVIVFRTASGLGNSSALSGRPPKFPESSTKMQ